MTKTFGLAGYVGGGTVKTGTKPTAQPFHLTAKVKTPKTTGLIVVTKVWR